MKPRLLRVLLLLIASIAALATGCVAQDRPECTPPAVELDLAISDRTLDPSDPAACRGQQVTLHVTADEAVVLHIHGYDDQATELAVGESVEVAFLAERSGQFTIEIHPLEDPAGIEVGILTVHER